MATKLTAAEKARRAAAAANNAGAKGPVAAASHEKTETAATAKVAPGALPDLPGISKWLGPAVHSEKKFDRTVVVVCKMPRGLFLQLTEFVDQDVPVMGGGVKRQRLPMRTGTVVRLKGSIVPFGKVPNYPIVGGFALTVDVDAVFWSNYFEQNKNLTMITEGLLAAFNNEADATAYCREYAGRKTGFEPLAQTGDKRIEASNSPNLSDIDIDTDTVGTRVA